MEPAPFYRPRNPRSTPLWKLSETLYERLRGEWEDRFEARFGFWRGLADEAVARYLDCGIPELGFARLRCDSCRRERLLTFSCRTRQLCPSCGAKRGVIFGAFLREEVVEPVEHARGSEDGRRDDVRDDVERIDELEFLARVVTQLPESRKHSIQYYGLLRGGS